MSNDMLEGHVAEHIDIQLDPETRSLNATTQQANIYNMPSFDEKIKLWLIIIILAGGSLLSNLCSFASSLGVFFSTNSTSPCSQWRPPMH